MLLQGAGSFPRMPHRLHETLGSLSENATQVTQGFGKPSKGTQKKYF